MNKLKAKQYKFTYVEQVTYEEIVTAPNITEAQNAFEKALLNDEYAPSELEIETFRSTLQ